MSLDKNRILIECDCGLIFRLTEDEIPVDQDFCGLIPEKDHGSRKRACFGHTNTGRDRASNEDE